MDKNSLNIYYRSSIFKVVVAILIISISAQLTVDVGEIPITGQTLAILILALLLKPIEIFYSTIIYLFIGLLGMPVFADGASGISKITGGSGGFLIGFVISSYIISRLHENDNNGQWLSLFWKTSLGTLIILLFGVGRLASIYGLEKGIEYGFIPFWQGAMIKIILGATLVFFLLKLKRKSITE